jgi:hypothetical protein
LMATEVSWAPYLNSRLDCFVFKSQFLKGMHICAW